MIIYIGCFISKIIIGSCAIAIFIDNPYDRRLGFFIGGAIGITLSQYITHFI